MNAVVWPRSRSAEKVKFDLLRSLSQHADLRTRQMHSYFQLLLQDEKWEIVALV